MQEFVSDFATEKDAVVNITCTNSPSLVKTILSILSRKLFINQSRREIETFLKIIDIVELNYG